MSSNLLMKGDPVPFAKSMSKLVNNKEFSDIKFIVGEERRHIFAHRCILVSRCEVFRAMFAEQVMRENSGKVPLVLTDTEPDIFMIVLEFIYTNCATLSGKTVVDVLASSIEYGLEELRKVCNAYLTQNLSEVTACETIQAAVTYGQDSLRNTVLAFIEEHTVAVFKHPRFEELSEESLAVILQSNRLKMDEMDILATVINWALVNATVQRIPTLQAISKVIKHVRLPLLSEDELQKVEKENEMNQVVPIEMVSAAWRFHALHRSDGINPQTRLRRGTTSRDSHHGLTPWEH
ncbi:BTB/POZ domain-containing protein 19-like [Diadema antillarum]|uniref:BTB/POZ domain-containing protein 19-like n=1 Tax=Diadema antillarum TaxID=105358 RepID=UPI003A8C7B8A